MDVLLRYHHVPDIERIEVYRNHGGYQALTKALRMTTDEILTSVQQSGLRGRGGAGFSTSVKWRSVAGQQRGPHYFICNAAEGEPGSFKDRALLRNPHMVLEATAISAHTIGAEKAFLYLRGAFREEERLLKQAWLQARNAGLLPVDLIVHRGEDNYIAGEETAMLESLEGKPAIPRTKPPRPDEHGLWDCPTVINNVETICNIIYIILYGAQSFRTFGTALSPGTKLFCLSGQIARPGLYELPLGIRLSTLLNESGGGPLPGRELRAVFPGGPSTPVVPVALDPAMDFESLRDAGSALGTGGVVVLDDSADLAKIAVETARFFSAESCNACPPCTVGTSETYHLFQNLEQRTTDSQTTILKIREFCEMMKHRGQCAHNRSAAFSLLSLLDRFPEAFRR